MAWRKTPSASRRTTSTRTLEPKMSRRERRAAKNSGALTASASFMRTSRGSEIPKKNWQSEGWDFYRSQGELWYATDWLGNAVSRVRLKAAKIVDGGDEPEIIEDGPVAEIVEALAGGIGGQSAMLKSFAVKLTIPGDSYLVGYVGENKEQHWDVYSADVIRKEMSGGFSVKVSDTAWINLPQRSLVVRIWNPDEQFPWLATSPTQAALGVLREIDLYNRKIITELTARLASNGIFFIPDEVTFPIREEYSDANDPFVSELIDIASKAITNPGSAAAALPIPLRVPSDMIDKFKHMTFSDNIVQETLNGRDKAIKRLATMVNVPAEVLTGMGDVNHWSAWQIEASAIKMHVVPIVEIICRGLTKGYLAPALAAVDFDKYLNDNDSEFEDAEVAVDGDERYVIWYDTSELEKKPDIGERAIQLHDRVVINDAALRRATGFNDVDAPTDEERDVQILTRLSYNGQQATNAYEMLTGTPVSGAEDAAASAPSGGANLPASSPGTGPVKPDQERVREGPEKVDAPQTKNDRPPMTQTSATEIDILTLPVLENAR